MRRFARTLEHGCIALLLSIGAPSTVGCSAPSPAGGTTAESTTVRGAASSSVPDPSTALAPAEDREWVVSIRGIQGDCAPDATSCDQRYEAASDGSWLRHEEPNPRIQGGRAITTRKPLPEAVFADLRTLVTSSAFDEEMSRGFACQGGKKDHDYTWRITFKTEVGERVQHAEYCISGPREATNTPRTLLRFLER